MFKLLQTSLGGQVQAKTSTSIFAHLVQKSYSATALDVSSPINTVLFHEKLEKRVLEHFANDVIVVQPLVQLHVGN